MKRKVKNKKSYKKIILIIIAIALVICSSFIFNKEKTDTTKIATQKIRAKTVQKIIDNGMMEEETLSDDNCEYTIEENGNVILNYYDGTKDSVVIPTQIDGKTIEKIDTTAFEDNTNLEVIKVPQEIAKNTEKLKDFEVNEKLSDNDYVVYTATQEYNEEYIKYIELSEEEKQKYVTMYGIYGINVLDFKR